MEHLLGDGAADVPVDLQHDLAMPPLPMRAPIS